MYDQVLQIIQRHLPGPLKLSGSGNVVTKCPFHKGGQERKPSFSVSLEKGLFHCFTCQQSGNIQKLLKLLGVPASAIEAETKILEPMLEANKERQKFLRENFHSDRDPFKVERTLPEAILGVFDHPVEPLRLAGFSDAILQQMEVGLDVAKRRVTYPLRDMYGNLAGISAGTFVKEIPKYKVYQGGRRDVRTNQWLPGDFGEWFDRDYPGYQCDNHDLLWNYHNIHERVIRDGQPIFVTEGFKACMWMLQHGYPNTVATMGLTVSEKQQRLLHRAKSVVLFLDNDFYGRQATLRLGADLWTPMHCRVEVVAYPKEDDNTQPDSYPGEQLHKMVEDRLPFGGYFHQQRKS